MVPPFGVQNKTGSMDPDHLSNLSALLRRSVRRGSPRKRAPFRVDRDGTGVVSTPGGQ